MARSRSSAADPASSQRIPRRTFLATVPGAAALACASPSALREPRERRSSRSAEGRAVMVGSSNALAGMQQHYAKLLQGADPLDVAIEVVKIVEADPEDETVGLGGLPNEDGVVQLDAAVMYGPTHSAGAVAALENILHPSEVARAVMERTDHCLLVGPGAYAFARAHGHPHVELLTERSRAKWLEWKETMSEKDDRLTPPKRDARQSARMPAPADAVARAEQARPTGTIHCSALSARGEIACTTTTSGLAFKIPGRVGDSPIIGAGLYCDQEAGSAGATGRGEACIQAGGSAAIVDLMRRGMAPVDAGLELLRRVVRQVERQAAWKPDLLDADGKPSFGLKFYVLGIDGTWAGVSLRGGGTFAVADPERGPRSEELAVLFP